MGALIYWQDERLYTISILLPILKLMAIIRLMHFYVGDCCPKFLNMKQMISEPCFLNRMQILISKKKCGLSNIFVNLTHLDIFLKWQPRLTVRLLIFQILHVMLALMFLWFRNIFLFLKIRYWDSF